MIYLDNAASTPLLPEVITDMQLLMQEVYGNPSSIHAFGRKAKVIVEDARKKIAGLTGASPSEIIFTSGGTEANNLALWSCVQTYNVKHIITAKTEHPAVLKPIEQISRTLNTSVSYLDVDKTGQIDTKQLDCILAEKGENVLVSLMHANNETGTLLPIKDVSEICCAHKAFFHSDMVQTIGKFKIDFSHIKIGFASCSAHKFHGPKGLGFLYVNNNNIIKPLILGGAQERNMRAGTENIVGIAGMAKALEIAQQQAEETQKHISVLKNLLVEKLHTIKNIKYNAYSDKKGLHSILSVAFPPTPQTEMLIYKLDMAGIAVSGGSACASGSMHTSPVLEAMNENLNCVSIRFSFSKFNTIEQINNVASVIKEILTDEKTT